MWALRTGLSSIDGEVSTWREICTYDIFYKHAHYSFGFNHFSNTTINCLLGLRMRPMDTVDSLQLLSSTDTFAKVSYPNFMVYPYLERTRLYHMASIKKYSPFLDMNRDEAYDLMKECVKEIQKRLVINLPNFEVSHYESIIYDIAWLNDIVLFIYIVSLISSYLIF